ncbi:hypothetical protein C8R47DRAFT_1081449 [Mycena vitilis]|nr:hypothetical protein C8R47DRAFT_1081449 [Mycena vitilis]
MSLSVEGIPALQVLFEPVDVTRVSVSFYQRLARVRGPRLPFTTIVPGFPPFSSVVDCAVGLINVDVVLGLDWASHIREILIHSGFRIDRSFDAWTFFHHADHPIRGVQLTQVPFPGPALYTLKHTLKL